MPGCWSRLTHSGSSPISWTGHHEHRLLGGPGTPRRLMVTRLADNSGVVSFAGAAYGCGRGGRGRASTSRSSPGRCSSARAGRSSGSTRSDTTAAGNSEPSPTPKAAPRHHGGLSGCRLPTATHLSCGYRTLTGRRVADSGWLSASTRATSTARSVPTRGDRRIRLIVSSTCGCATTQLIGLRSWVVGDGTARVGFSLSGPAIPC